MTTFRRGLCCFASLAIFAFGLPSVARAATITVDTLSDLEILDGSCSLREAILAAKLDTAVDTCIAGEPTPDRVDIPPGTYDVGTPLVIDGASGPLELHGLAAPTRPGLVGSGPPHAILSVTSGQTVTVDHLQISFGSPGILSSEAHLVVRDCLLGLNPNRALAVSANGAGSLLVERSVISNNTATGTSAGIRLFLIATTARIVDSTFSQNFVASDGNDATGGGLGAEVLQGGSLRVERTVFEQNRCTPPPGGVAQGTGAYVQGAFNPGPMQFVDVTFRGNNAVATPLGGQTGALFILAAGPLTLDRLRFEGNDPAEEGMQLWLEAGLFAPVSVQNVLFANGPAHAMKLYNGLATARLGHLTAWGHAGAAILLPGPSGAVLLDNSILWGNGAAVEPAGVAVVGPTNLIDIDPLFTDAVGGDFSLLADSPAIDAGDATVLPAPAFDLAHAPRLVGLDSDAGAFERGGLFADDFESADLSAWSSSASLLP